MTAFTELADRVHLLRYPVLDVNVTLVVGDGAALVVDTLSTPAQAAELRAAVRAVTPHPVTMIINPRKRAVRVVDAAELSANRCLPFKHQSVQAEFIAPKGCG